jgi:ethanolamine transporter EutH
MCDIPANIALAVTARFPRGAARGFTAATVTEKITQPIAVNRYTGHIAGK